MADVTEKQVIIDVKVERGERIKELLNQMGSLTKEIVECDMALSELKKEVKSNGKITKEQADTLAKLTAERKAANKQLQSLSREEQNLVVANTAAKGSVEALRAEYNALNQIWLKATIGSEEYLDAQQKMISINEQLSAAEQSVGKFSRNVGNYASGFSEIGFQVQQLARELPTLSIGLPQFFLALSNNIPLFTDALVRARNEGKNTGAILKDIGKSLISWQTLLVAVISIITMFGDEIIEWVKSLGKADSGVKALRKSMSEMVGSIAAERAELIGLFDALGKAEEGSANYLAVRNVILDKYGSLLENEREEVRNLNDIATAYDVIAKKITGKAIMEGFSKQIEEQSGKFGETYNKYFAELLPSFNEKFGKEATPKLIEFLGLLQEGTTESVSKAKEFAKVFTNEVGNNVLLTNFGVGTIFGKDTNLLSKISKDFAESTREINATTQAMQELGKFYGFNAGDTKGGKGNEAFQKAQRALELEQKLAEEQLKAERATAYNSEQIYNASEEAKFAFAQKWDKAEFEQQQKHQQEMLDLQLQHGEITQEQYNTELAVLAAQKKTFDAEQLTASEEAAIKMREQLMKDAEALRKDVLKYNEETEKKANKQKWEAYRQSVKDLVSEGVISATEGADLTTASYASEKAADNAITTKYIRAKRSEEQTKGRNIQELVGEQYSGDLRQFSDSETERLQLAIETQKAIIEERKKAGLTTYKEEADLLRLEKQLKASMLNDELAMAWRNSAQQYEIRKKFLEDELKLYEGNAAEQARIQKEIAENESNHRQEQLSNFQTYTSEVGDALGGVSDLANTLYDRELETEKANNEMALSDLEKRYKAGLISAKEYNKEKVRLDEELAKKEAIIARKQAIMERAMALFNIGVNTASAIMKIWAETPKADFGVMTGVLTALAAATGAAQTAAVLAQPLPKARKGGRIQGATHEAGGVLIETERDERIIGANPSKAYPELLNLISYLGKRKMRLPDTGYATRRAQTISPDVLASEVGRQVAVAIDTNNQKQAEAIGQVVGREVAAQMKKVKIYTAVTDVNKAERLHTRIVQAAKQ